MRTYLRLLGFALVVALLVSCAAPPVEVPPTGATSVPEATTALSPTTAVTEIVAPTVAATAVVSPTLPTGEGVSPTAVATEVVSPTTVATGVVSPTVAATAAVSPTGAATVAATLVAAGDVTIQVANHPTYGMILTDAEGMVLYIFTSDTPGVSNCSGNCATAWPPLTVPSGTEPMASPDVTGTLDTIQRADGTTQVTINDMPLYYYQDDTAAGDTKGQGLNDRWYVVSPAGEMITE